MLHGLSRIMDYRVPDPEGGALPCNIYYIHYNYK